MRTAVIFLLVAVCTVVSCGGAADPVIDPGDGDTYAVSLDPNEFVSAIDNPWLPLLPGSRWVYEEETDEGVERVEVVVTTDTRIVSGIVATVVRDMVTRDGEVIEDTYDWFAQDAAGNVWYLGEDSREYEDGEFVTAAGSWEAGVDGALPGIVMKAVPQAGDAYRQEYYPDEAEDMAEILGFAGAADVPYGSFTDLLVIREWTPLEPDVIEEKYYAPGIGLVMERTVAGETGRAGLVSFEAGG